MEIQVLRTFSEKLKNFSLNNELNIMEVCGTHTTEFFKSGIQDIFPAKLNLVDGPGCPVCVTPNSFIDRAIEISKNYGTIITTFGDMMRVPSSYSSLQQERARKSDIRIVYSPLDAVKIAKENPGKEIVFLSIGFETTIPTEAAAVIKAKSERVRNFSILVGNKLTPPAVKAILDFEEINIAGFILPGHVSTITGVRAWRFVAEDYNKPCIIAGFEKKDLLVATLMLLNLIQQGTGNILNEYQRAVTDTGNIKAQKIIHDVFERCGSKWRGIGLIPDSGMKLNKKYADFDAEKKFPVDPPPEIEIKGCKCGEVLRGVLSPPECPLFGKTCTPTSPAGACMVSSEGSCSAYYKYNGFH